MLKTYYGLHSPSSLGRMRLGLAWIHIVIGAGLFAVAGPSLLQTWLHLSQLNRDSLMWAIGLPAYLSLTLLTGICLLSERSDYRRISLVATALLIIIQVTIALVIVYSVWTAQASRDVVIALAEALLGADSLAFTVSLVTVIYLIRHGSKAAA